MKIELLLEDAETIFRLLRQVQHTIEAIEDDGKKAPEDMMRWRDEAERQANGLAAKIHQCRWNATHRPNQD